MLSNGIDGNWYTLEGRSKIMPRFELKAQKGVFSVRSALKELINPYYPSPCVPTQASRLLSTPRVPAMVQTIISHVD